jgi:hypothetical protein
VIIIRSHLINTKRLVMSATADSSCGELSGALQRNAKHEARLSNIADYFLKRQCRLEPETNLRFFSRDCGIRMTKSVYEIASKRSVLQSNIMLH